MTEPWALIVAAGVGFLGGFLTTFATWKQANRQLEQERTLAAAARADADQARLDAKIERDQAAKERQDERREQHLFDALQYFTGETQRRGVGISIVEGFLEKVPELRSTLMPLLTSQAIFLLAESDQVWKSHEQNNLKRIMRLALKYKDDEGVAGDHYTILRDTIQHRLDDEDARKSLIALNKDNVKKGVHVEKEELEAWLTRLAVPSRRPVPHQPISCVRFGYQES